MEMKYFDLIKPGTTHDFVKYRRIAVVVSLIVNTLVLLGVQGWPGLQSFRFDPEVGDKLDFFFKQPVDENALKSAVEKLGTPVKEVRKLIAREGQEQEYTVITQGTADKIGSALREKYGQDQVEVVRTDYVGPQVGKQLRVDGILAVVYAIGMILVYVGFRFDFRFSPGVVIALVHDAIMTLGFFVGSGHEFNLT